MFSDLLMPELIRDVEKLKERVRELDSALAEQQIYVELLKSYIERGFGVKVQAPEEREAGGDA